MTRIADLLVIGTSVDPHIASVLRRLRPNVNVCRFNVDEYPKDTQVAIELSGHQTRVVIQDIDRNSWNVTNPGVFWFRRLGKPGISHQMDPDYKDFCIGEIEQTIEGLASIIRPQYYLNDLWSTRLASNKLRQYSFATQCGLRMPSTMVTNSPQSFLEWSPKDAVVAKSLSRPLLTDQQSSRGRTFAYTHKISPADINEIQGIANTPVQFQALVEPAYELRVTSLEGNHYAVAIDSSKAPQSKRSRYDWRAVATECSYTSATLSQYSSECLSRLLERLGLTFAASDFIVDTSGNEWFLETNPNGAWLWLESFVEEFCFTDILADFINTILQSIRD